MILLRQGMPLFQAFDVLKKSVKSNAIAAVWTLIWMISIMNSAFWYPTLGVGSSGLCEDPNDGCTCPNMRQWKQLCGCCSEVGKQLAAINSSWVPIACRDP